MAANILTSSVMLFSLPSLMSLNVRGRVQSLKSASRLLIKMPTISQYLLPEVGLLQSGPRHLGDCRAVARRAKTTASMEP
jgi:hypothetical protein